MIAQMQYTIGYYSEAVQADILGLPAGLQGRYIALTERMCVSGAHLGEPHSSAMGNGLLELRLKSHEGIARVMYCTLVGRRIVMLHCFVKKTQKTPLADLALARKRLLEVKHA
jgi:phage-related protein